MNLDETPEQLAARAELAVAMQELGHALVGHHVDIATATELAEVARKYTANVRHGQPRDRASEMLTSTRVTAALSGIRAFGAITPIGGLAFLAGWGLLVWAAVAR